MYKFMMFQHQSKSLSYIMWVDNNIVRTLSNFHTPEISEVGKGVVRRRRVEQKDYCETFHLIDKGNGKESTCGMRY
jgi:hypothetical protein